MNGAILDSTFNFFFKLKYAKTLRRDAGHAARHRATSRVGEITWALLRGAHLLGRVPAGDGRRWGWSASWWAVLALPAALLIGFGVRGRRDGAAPPSCASLAGLRLRQLAILPMFLFSATFFPLDRFPDVAAVGRRAHPALPRGRALPRADHRHRHLGRRRSRLSTWSRSTVSAWPSSASGSTGCCCPDGCRPGLSAAPDMRMSRT